jgi:sphinganine C4-monooxygenase
LCSHRIASGLLLDSAGGALAHLCARMTVRQGILLFTFSTYKTVCDHGGYAFPVWLDPLHLFFPNNAEYHDVHHQMQGLRYNFSQPFFVHFDVLFGTRMGAERFAKLKQASLEKRGTYGKQADASAGEKQAASSATATEPSPTRAADDLRRRKAFVGAAQDEASVETLLAGERGDPTVTTDAQSYRAKAGTAAA